VTIDQVQFTPARWEQFWEAFKGEPQQLAGIEELRQAIVKADPCLLTETASWAVNFRKTPENAPPATGCRLLAVKYQSQRDNKTSGADNASRTCFSSSCAMLAMTVKPGCVAGDDAYIQKRQPFGDSTDGGAQVACLKSLGINARFTQQGTNDTIKKQIDRGIPVPCGILHHGTPSAPSGGHWICVIGYDDVKGGFIVHDPWGEIDNASGTYPDTNGASKLYSYKLFDSRWTVDGNSDGWAVLVD
jgi:hypothetical protein